MFRAWCQKWDSWGIGRLCDISLWYFSQAHRDWAWVPERKRLYKPAKHPTKKILRDRFYQGHFGISCAALDSSRQQCKESSRVPSSMCGTECGSEPEESERKAVHIPDILQLWASRTGHVAWKCYCPTGEHLSHGACYQPARDLRCTVGNYPLREHMGDILGLLETSEEPGGCQWGPEVRQLSAQCHPNMTSQAHRLMRPGESWVTPELLSVGRHYFLIRSLIRSMCVNEFKKPGSGINWLKDTLKVFTLYEK